MIVYTLNFNGSLSKKNINGHVLTGISKHLTIRLDILSVNFDSISYLFRFDLKKLDIRNSSK